MGQVFTPEPVARFMAGLPSIPPGRVRVLDAGAGAGVLAAALAERIAGLPDPRAVRADAFEMDPTAAAALAGVLRACGRALTDAGHAADLRVRCEDFGLLESAGGLGLLPGGGGNLYDVALMNPPYGKVRADSPHAAAARRVGPAQPNFYSLFMAAAADRLAVGGELVAVTPRSWCNGRYFRDFRRWLFGRCDLVRVHLFGSRTATFRESGVLQESVVTHVRRVREPGGVVRVAVSRSVGRDLADPPVQRLPAARVVGPPPDRVVTLPERAEDAAVADLAAGWPGTFADAGLRVSTGPVVMFRTRLHHRAEPGPGDAALLSAHHVRGGRVAWPRPKPKWPAAFATGGEAARFLLPADVMVLVKRFSAKEEHRRLSAAVLLPGDVPGGRVAVENHLNYVTGAADPVTPTRAAGVAALLNSALLDRLFRGVSGSTQVNATDLRALPFPPIKAADAVGAAVAGSADPAAGERAVLDVLGVRGPVRRYLEGFAP